MMRYYHNVECMDVKADAILQVGTAFQAPTPPSGKKTQQKQQHKTIKKRLDKLSITIYGISFVIFGTKITLHK